MSVLTKNHVLVLNKGWSPVGAITVQKAIVMLWSEYANGEPKARIVDFPSYQQFTWADWSKFRPAATDEAIRAANISFKIPEIILLSRYERLPAPKAHFSRRTLYKRDHYTCQYCGARPGSEELSIDHVLPKSQGGGTTWENCVLACVECNSRKADKTPEQAKMKLLTVPKKPKASIFRCDLAKKIDSWQSFLGESYWSVPLKD
jgi:5-methylcytosine-specific restriction endonuclease McrA